MLTLNGEGPLSLQLYRAIQNDIVSGALTSGDRLPSSRELAKTLSISRNVVMQCYEQLAAQGHIDSKQGSGSFVSDLYYQLDDLCDESVKGKRIADATGSQIPFSEPRISDNAQSMLPMWRQYRSGFSDCQESLIDFQYGHVAVDYRLGQQLKLNLKTQWQGIGPSYQHPSGIPYLRQVIAKYLRQYRGVVCHEDQILITNGSQEGLSIVCQMLLNPDDRVIMEDPGYRGAIQAFRSVRANIDGLPVDEFGLDTRVLPESPEQPPRLLYTTPSHQFPTGGVMPLARRAQLLHWARRHHCMILEDDYDSEFRYQGAPIESIQGMDPSGPVIYMGTFSKIISPALRLGFLVLPEALVEPASAIKWTCNRHSPTIVQQMLAQFLDSVHFTRHLRRMNKRYQERRTVLIESLHDALGDQVTVHGANAGIHLLAWLNLTVEYESQLIALAKANGVGIHTVTNLYQQTPKKIGLLMGYANLSNTQIGQGVKILAESIQSLNR